MTVSKGVATAQFSNLPEYMKDATNLHVRLWYAQTGLGPVYLYHEADNASDANVSELLNVDETEMRHGDIVTAGRFEMSGKILMHTGMNPVSYLAGYLLQKWIRQTEVH
mgnify:CR=1 FL=1